ncbi:MAG TPA: hypothetical protein VNZ86_10080 [Bacteroidia bacterium]|nr:hypothetical protein [Bacteroidia bacterium]
MDHLNKRDKLPFTFDHLTNLDSINKSRARTYATAVRSDFHGTSHYVVYGHYKPISRIV